MTYPSITEWAKEQQIDLVDGQIPPEVRKLYLDSQKSIDEKPPVIPKPNPVARIKEAVKRADPPSTKRAVSSTRHVRVSVDRLIGRAWGWLAQIAQPVNLPVGRILAMQSPVAGAIIEDVIVGTPVDKILQPIARFEEKGELAFALIGPPMIVAAITARPNMAPILIPMLKDALRTWITVAGPKLKKIEEQDKKFNEEYGVDIDAMIEMLFAPPTPPTPEPTNGNTPTF
jgi:hypothetical protein